MRCVILSELEAASLEHALAAIIVTVFRLAVAMAMGFLMAGA